VSAAKAAADYYVQCLTEEGREPSYKELAKAAERSESWGAQQLRALRKAQQWTPEDDAAALAATKAADTGGREVPEADSKPAEGRTEARAAVRQPFAARGVVWVAFLLGLGASVAANVEAAQDGIGPKVAAGFASIALLLSVEILARFRTSAKGRWLLYGGTGVIAAVAAVVSYGHMRSLLLEYGESNLAATILPLAPDGLILVSCVALMTMQRGK
jgi:hypothetical protein